MPSIAVDDNGTELTYVDSGVPKEVQAEQGYLTIIAIHGMVFCAPIFERIMESSAEAGKNGIPAIPPDRKTGGILLLGWSFGCAFGLSVLANFDVYPEAMRARLALYLRSYVMFEDQRTTAFVVSVTSYFKHGDLSTRDPNVLSYWVPELIRAPSIFNMSEDEYATAVYTPPGDKSEMLFMFFCEPAIQQTYKKACFDKNNRDLFPEVKIWVLSGDVTSPHGLPAFWSIQDDDAKHGGGFVEFGWVSGANYFHFWDEPGYMLDKCLQCA